MSQHEQAAVRLADFYQSIHDWLAGTDETPYYSSVCGLCYNLHIYYEHHGLEQELYHDMISLMESSFRDAGLSQSYPFDEPAAYIANKASRWTNPARLAWVEAHRSGA